MKTLKRILSLISAVLLLNGCSKEKSTIIKGSFTSTALGTPIQGLTVYVQHLEYDAGLNTILKKTTVTKSVTDANGQFNMEVRLTKGLDYGIEWQKKSECINNTNPRKVNVGEINEFPLDVEGASQVYIHIKSITPIVGNDGIAWYYDKNYIPKATDFSAPNDFKTRLLLFGTNELFYLKSYVRRNNVVTSRLDSVFAKPCDSLTINILY